MSAQALVRTSLKTSKRLLEDIQEVLKRRYGKVKGVQEACLSDALKLWMGFLGGHDGFLYGVVLSGGLEEGRALSVEEIAQTLDGSDYAYLRPANEHGVFTPAVIDAVLKYVLERGLKAYSTSGAKAEEVQLEYQSVAEALTNGHNVYFLQTESDDPISAALKGKRAISLTRKSLLLTTRAYLGRLIKEEKCRGSSLQPLEGQGTLEEVEA